MVSLEENGDGDDAPVVVRARATWFAASSGLMLSSFAEPLSAGPRVEAQRLQDRDVERRGARWVSQLSSSSSALALAGLRAASSEHRRDEHVVCREVREQVGAGVAQRRHVHGHPDAPGRVDCVGEGVHVGDVVGGELRPVEEDANAWGRPDVALRGRLGGVETR